MSDTNNAVEIVKAMQEINALQDELNKLNRAQAKFRSVQSEVSKLIERWKSQQYTYRYNTALGEVIKRNEFEGHVADNTKREFRARVTEMDNKFAKMNTFYTNLNTQISMNDTRIGNINNSISLLKTNISNLEREQATQDGKN